MKNEVEEKARFIDERFEEVIHRLYVIHKMRWTLGDTYASLENNEEYFLANEILSETEKKLWSYLKGETDKM